MIRLTRREFAGGGLSLVALGVAGCATERTPATFDLEEAGDVAKVKSRRRATLIIAQPEAIQALDTDRIVVRQAGGELSYLANSRLADSMPDLVQAKMLRGFETAGFASVGRPGDRLDGDVTLNSEIRSFEIDAVRGEEAKVSIAAKLISDRSGRIFASEVFTATVPATTATAAQAIAGLDEALKTVIGQMVRWAAKSL